MLAFRDSSAIFFGGDVISLYSVFAALMSQVDIVERFSLQVFSRQSHLFFLLLISEI